MLRTIFSKGLSSRQVSHRALLQPRGFSSSLRARSNSADPAGSGSSFSDSTRPDLYYHLLHPPNPLSKDQPVFGLSFLPNAPKKADSPGIIGYLPAVAEESGESGLNDFKENSDFLELTHDAIRSALADGADEIQTAAAVQTVSGWMHISDERNPPALGRIPDPEDIIGSVRVEEGKIIPETYKPMPSYRVCTRDGVTTLTPGLAARVVQAAQEAELKH